MHVRIFEFNPETANVKKVKPKTALTPAHQLAFSPDSKKLIIATQDSLIQVYDIETDSILKTFGEHQGEFGMLYSIQYPLVSLAYLSCFLIVMLKDGKRTIATITHLAVSDDGNWIGSVDTVNRLNIYNLPQLQHHATLPRYFDFFFFFFCQTTARPNLC